MTGATGLIEPLTRRELEVLGFIAAGRPNREIADQLVVTLDTVKKHTTHVFDRLGAAMAKLGVDGLVEAAAIAHRLGFG